MSGLIARKLFPILEADRILGVLIPGARVSDMIAEAAMAVDRRSIHG